MDNRFDRILVTGDENIPGLRMSINNFEDVSERRGTIQNSTDLMQDAFMRRQSVISKKVPYNAQTSRSNSFNYGLPRQSIRDSKIIEQEMAPLQKNPCNNYSEKNVKNHTCTDVPCLIIFVCFICAWMYVASYALSKGDLSKVLIPTDSQNAKCGYDSGVLNKRMLFFFNLDKCIDPLTPISGCDTKQICVESCPNSTFVWKEDQTEKVTDINALRDKLICDTSIDKRNLKNLTAIEKAIANEQCSGWYLKSSPLFNHCIWDFKDNICNILPSVLSGRKPRSNFETANFVDMKPIQKKFTAFLERTKNMCLQNNDIDRTVKEKTIKSNSNLNRVLAAIISQFNYNNKSILADQIAIDLQNSWKVIIFAFIVHLIAVLIFITLLRWIASALVWTSICGVIFGLTMSVIYCFRQYRLWSTEPHVPQHGKYLMAKIQNIFQTEDVWLYSLIILGALLLITLLIIFVIRKRISIAIAIIKEASKAITAIKSSIFFPIFPGILYIIVTILAGIIMLYLSSIGTFSFLMIRRMDNDTEFVPEKCICSGPKAKPYVLGDNCQPELFEEYCHLENDPSKPCVHTSCSFNEIIKSQKTQWFMLLNIFGFLWVTFFISAYEDMVLACTFSIWYWTFHKKNIPKFPLFKAICRTTVYHLGTLAFGSLILTVCRIIRYILEMIQKKAKLYDNKLAHALLWCMKCFFWLLENFLRFLNRNAYITCAIHSTNFCSSSKKSFSLITQNVLRVYTIDKVSDFLFFLSKFLVTGCTTFITYFFLITYPQLIPVYHPFVPVALIAIISYIMAHFIFSTYSMAVDTLFFCFLEDSTENDGSAENPFYMSKELRKLLGKSQKKRRQIKT